MVFKQLKINDLRTPLNLTPQYKIVRSDLATTKPTFRTLSVKKRQPNFYFCCELKILKMQGTATYLPIAIMMFVAFGFVFTVMFLTHVLVPLVSPKTKSKVKSDPFECGIEPQGNARTPFSIKYFLVAVLFVLFDVEIIFMYPWAVNFKKLGLFGLFEMFTFIGIFLVGFFYIVKKGALDWDK